jgi:hypothetical protein
LTAQAATGLARELGVDPAWARAIGDNVDLGIPLMAGFWTWYRSLLARNAALQNLPARLAEAPVAPGAAPQEGSRAVNAFTEWEIIPGREGDVRRAIDELTRWHEGMERSVTVIPDTLEPAQAAHLAQTNTLTGDIVIYYGERYGGIAGAAPRPGLSAVRAEELIHSAQLDIHGLLGRELTEAEAAFLEREAENILRDIGCRPIGGR